MKEYDKEKLNEYAKELFALCLDKGIDLNTISNEEIHITTDKYYVCYLTKELFDYRYTYSEEELHLPIWELIEKVKAL